MLTYAIIVLAIAATGGLLLGALHVQGRRPATPLALGHGLLAIAGLALLVQVIFSLAQPGLIALSLVFFGGALLIGLYMFGLRMGGKQISITLIALHSIFALLGFVCLLAGFVFSRMQQQ